MNNFLLDTNIVINYLHNKEKAIETIEKIQNEILYVNSIVVAEFRLGTMLSENKEKQNQQFIEFLESGNIKILSIDEQTANVYARIQSKQIKKGKMKPPFDTLIAANCIANDLILVTENKKHFEGIEELKIFSL